MGWALGVERLISLLKKKKVNIPDGPSVDIFIIQLGDNAKKKAIRVIEELEESG